MTSFNKVLLMGNLTRSPELSYTPSAVAVCHLGLAVNNTYIDSKGKKQEDPLFVDVTVWKKQAENCKQYLHKGSPVFIEGRLQLDHWEKDGQKHTKIKVIAQQVKFLGSKPETDKNQPETGQDEGEGSDIPF